MNSEIRYVWIIRVDVAVWMGSKVDAHLVFLGYAGAAHNPSLNTSVAVSPNRVFLALPEIDVLVVERLEDHGISFDFGPKSTPRSKSMSIFLTLK